MEKSKPVRPQKPGGSRFEKLKKNLLQLKNQVHVVYLASRDRRTPWYAKAVAGLTVAYALSPIDLVPDFIPVLGYLDDLLIVPAGIALAIKLIPKEVIAEAREKVSHSASPIQPIK